MENLQLHKRLEQVTRAAGAVSSVDYREKSNLRPPSSPSSDRMSALKRRDRMSLQSPIVAKYNLLDTRMDHAGWHGAPPNSPLITSMFFLSKL